MDIGLHHNGEQGLVDAAAALQEGREERPGAQLRDLQVEVPGRGAEGARSGAVAERGAVARALEWGGTDERGRLRIDQFLNRPIFCASCFLVKRQDSGRESARSRFPLRVIRCVELSRHRSVSKACDSSRSVLLCQRCGRIGRKSIGRVEAANQSDCGVPRHHDCGVLLVGDSADAGRVAGDRVGSWGAFGAVARQRYLDRMLAQQCTQPNRVFNCVRRSLAEVWRHCMGCVSEKHRPLSVIGAKRWSEAKDVVCEKAIVTSKPDERGDRFVPAFETSKERRLRADIWAGIRFGSGLECGGVEIHSSTAERNDEIGRAHV